MPRGPNDVCSRCGKPVYRSPTSRPVIVCHPCRREIGPPASKFQPKPCEQCGEIFTPKPRTKGKPPQRFCSLSCGRTWVNLNVLHASKPRLTPEQKRERQAQAAKTKCRKRRLRLAAVGWDGVTDADILDRDKWMCKMPVCIYGSRRISKTRKYPDKRSPGIDHIVPISLGGDDTAFNKRAAHHGCNMARGAGRPGEQMPLNFSRSADEIVLPRERKNARKARVCGTCGEPMRYDGKRWRCDLHSPVYILTCTYCPNPVICRLNNAGRVVRCKACRSALNNAARVAALGLTCEAAGCERPVFFRATPLCAPHYHRLKRYGDVFEDIPIASDRFTRFEITQMIHARMQVSA